MLKGATDHRMKCERWKTNKKVKKRTNKSSALCKRWLDLKQMVGAGAVSRKCRRWFEVVHIKWELWGDDGR